MLDDFFAGKHIAKLLGGLEHVLFLHILGIIIPTAFHIFRGVETTNQKINRKRSFIIWPHISTNLTFKPHKWERREYQWIINRILTGILMEKAGTMDGKRMICIYYIIYIYILYVCIFIYLRDFTNHGDWWHSAPLCICTQFVITLAFRLDQRRKFEVVSSCERSVEGAWALVGLLLLQECDGHAIWVPHQPFGCPALL